MSTVAERAANSFSTLAEKALHAALKAWYARPGDRFEVPVDGYVVDIVRGDLLIEVQTGTLSPLNRKVAALAASCAMRIIIPIPKVKWIVRVDDGGAVIGRRRSPRQGDVVDLFGDLVHGIPILRAPRAEIEVVLTQEEEVRRRDMSRLGWRRHGWVIEERRLLGVCGTHRFRGPADLLPLLPGDLDEPFTTADLAACLDRPVWLGRRMAYCLRETGMLRPVGKRGNALLYRRA